MSGSVEIRSIGLDGIEAHRRHGRPIVIVAWHGHAVAHLAAYHRLFGPDSQAVIMPLTSSRGEVLSRFARGLDIEVIPLGVTPGARARAVCKLIHSLEQGCNALLAADGPAGPAEQVKEAIVRIAERAGATLIPSGLACNRAVSLGCRWDNHLVPLPWSRVVFYFGAGIQALHTSRGGPASAGIRRQLEERLRLANLAARESCLAASNQVGSRLAPFSTKRSISEEVAQVHNVPRCLTSGTALPEIQQD